MIFDDKTCGNCYFYEDGSCFFNPPIVNLEGNPVRPRVLVNEKGCRNL